MEVKAKNKNLRQELMILIKTNKILESRMLHGLGTIDEASLGYSAVDDESTNSFVGCKQANSSVSFLPNSDEIMNPNTDTKSNLKIAETFGSPVDMIIETSRATDHNMLIPEITYSSDSNLDHDKYSSTESDLVLLDNPRVVERNRLLQSRY